MKIIIVRHGHPDYDKDCLTSLGHLHAQAVAERLADEEIDAVYTSTCGRAYETAEYICRKKGLPIAGAFDFLREMNWVDKETLSDYQKYHPWLIALDMVKAGKPLTKEFWEKEELSTKSLAFESAEKISKGFDAFLQDLGYVREGLYYRVGKPNNKTFVVVCHGGVTSILLSSMLNLPQPFAFAGITWNQTYTAVTELFLEGEEGELILPHFGIVNDARHVAKISE